MARLGVRHKVTLDSAPDQLKSIFPVLGHVQEPYIRQCVRRWKAASQTITADANGCIRHGGHEEITVWANTGI